MGIFVDGSWLTAFGIEGTNYCGPGYADGKMLGPNDIATYLPPALGDIDRLCKEHDQKYDALPNSTNPAEDRINADFKLINDMTSLMNTGQLNPRDTAIAAAVVEAFTSKMIAYDVPAIVDPNFQTVN